MGLFDQVVNAINDPDRQASTDQIGSILNTVQQLSSNQGVDVSTAQTAMSVVGNYVRSSLKEKRASGEPAQAIVEKFSGTNPSTEAVQALFSTAQKQQLVQDLVQRTGVNPDTIESLIPVLVPVALNFLQTGANAQNPQQGDNNVLNSFLDADGDGDVDMGDMLSMAGKMM